MNNSQKIDFIAKLLAHQDIHVNEKERFFMLTKDEIQKMGEVTNDKLKEILERIEKLEKGEIDITASLKDAKPTEKRPKNTFQQKTPNPKHVAEFMSLFNQRDGFKYLTHDYFEEDDFNIEEFTETRKKLFKDITYKKLNIPHSLWSIVNQFAFNIRNEPIKWKSISEDYKEIIPSINISWASQELQDWSKQTKLHPWRNDEYKRLINNFRRITRIESTNLEKLVESVIEKVFSDGKNNFSMKKIELSKADFYTHVEFLKLILECVFQEIKKYAGEDIEKRNIKIEYIRDTEDNFFIRKIKITHYNSFPPKELNLLLQEWFTGKGNMGEIRVMLQGYCYWSVVTKIEDKPVKVNILKEKDKPKCEEVDISDVDGFTHIFTFYYK